MASTASLSPLTTLNTPGGSPASVNNSAMRSPGEGSRSDGFSTKVLPQASATGNIHIGTIVGKLNGVIPAQTPSGWRTDQLSIPRPTCSVNSPLSRCGMPGEFDDLGAARDLTRGVAQHLAVLLTDQPGERTGFAIEKLAELEQDARAGQRRGRRPSRKGSRCGAHRHVDLTGSGKGDAAGSFAGRRVANVPPAPAASVDPLAVDIMVDIGHAITRSLILAGRYHRPAAALAAGTFRGRRSD